MHGVWWHILLTVGYGLLSSLVPVFNAEAYVVATMATHLLHPIEVGVGLGFGSGIGKMIFFQAVRHAKSLPFLENHKKAERPAPEPGTWRYRWSLILRWGNTLVTNPRLAPIGFFLSGSISVPPSYPTTILIATTKANFVVFSIFMTLGLMARYTAIAYGATGIFKHALHFF